MRLNQSSDFSLRILMHLGQCDTPQTVEMVSEHLGLARSHVMKIVAKLGRLGLIETSRGRGGGIRLGKPADEIRIGDVVREMEPDQAIVDCLKAGPTVCAFLPRCALKPAMRQAAEAFLDSLNRHTLASLLVGTQEAQALNREKAKA
ncbi:Rrf2 family transcriptional regulator [Rhizobiales bacterium]|uniref:Rrf2 family transcriptional regulator n=1 Tax=Hongsoonwoonella zoysiae TaxID=2821844 RepID=UPI00155F754A|nr:Rrf2 family transcriptional regulator [Hongsoonwoonella zoysiae]NRG19858.1 Rrf2 family transcriptional regulator [Hongsoonwoonella zoysiae]